MQGYTATAVDPRRFGGEGGSMVDGEVVVEECAVDDDDDAALVNQNRPQLEI